MLMKFAPSLRNTVVEFGFASVLRVSANVFSQILVGRRVWKDFQHAPVSLNKTRCVMMWPTCVVRQELRFLNVEVFFLRKRFASAILQECVAGKMKEKRETDRMKP